MRISIIQDSKIINIVEAFDLADAQQSYPECTVRAALDTDKRVEQVPAERFVTAAQYRKLFTDAEIMAILASPDIGVQLLLLKISTTPPEGVDLMSESVSEGLVYLVSKSLLAANRPVQIIG